MLSLKESILEDKKIKTYALVKSNLKFETYLDVLSDYSERSYFAKLPLSAHNLQIGRFGMNKIPRLGKQTVEDEVHFLMSCPLYSTERQKMLDIIHKKFPSTLLLNPNDMFLWLMTQENVVFIKSIGKFCKKSFKIRDETNPNLLSFNA